MRRLWQDLRYAARVLEKSPGFTLTAILTLALGIGANTAIFTLIDGVMLRSLPVQDPQRLMVFSWKAHHQPKRHGTSSYGDCYGNGATVGCTFPLPLFQQMRSQANVFSGITAFAGPLQTNLSGNGPGSIARAEVVTGDYFATLGIKAAEGRLFGLADDSPAAPAVLVLSFGYWQSAFGGDRSAIGRTIRLDNAPFTIVGVADAHFTNFSPGKTQDFWVPLAKIPGLNTGWLTEENIKSPQSWWLVIVGRLNPSVSIAEAQATTSSVFRNEMLHGAEPYSKSEDDPSIVLTPAPQGLTGGRGDYSTLLYILMSAVGVVLLIACANVAGLMLARSTARQKEIAVRRALGAGCARVVRQLLTESLTLSIFGGALGVLLAYWGVEAIKSLMSRGADRPFPFIVTPDWRILAFTISASFLTGILFGLAPALRSTRIDLAPALKENASTAPGGVTGRWFHLADALVVGQVALSILVLIGAGLLVRTLQNLRNINPGFEPSNLLLFGIAPSHSGYKDSHSYELYRDLQASFAATPGVESVSYSSDALLSGSLWSEDIQFPGQTGKISEETDVLEVGPGFFATMKIPLFEGRVFQEEDFASAAAAAAKEEEAGSSAKKPEAAPAARAQAKPAAQSAPRVPIQVVVNQAFVQKFLKGKNPLGETFHDSQADEPGPPPVSYQIIGVVGNTKYATLRREIDPTMYRVVPGGEVSFELRTAGEPMKLVPVVRDIVNRVDNNVPIFDIRTQSAQIEQLLMQERLIARLSTFFGIAALILACLGLYGLLAYEVTRRTRELGIRIALGAQQSDVLRLVAGQGGVLVLCGLALGIGAAIGLTQFMASVLYGVHPNDPLTIVAAACLLGAIGFLASYIPARRAMRVDPMVALRYE